MPRPNYLHGDATSQGTGSCRTSCFTDVPTERYRGRHNVGATASKILLDDSTSDNTLTARGVVFKTQDGTEYKIRAKREVILAAGAFQTPKLLELFGIGRMSLLEELGIPCKLDNPAVGENLQDHLMTGVSFEVTDGIMTGDTLLRQESGIMELFMQMYQEHKAGPFASGSLTSYAFTPIMSEAISELDPGAQSNFEEALKDMARLPQSAFGRSHADFLIELMKRQSEAT